MSNKGRPYQVNRVATVADSIPDLLIATGTPLLNLSSSSLPDSSVVPLVHALLFITQKASSLCL